MFFLCDTSYHTVKKQFSFQIILSVSTDCSKPALCKQNDIFLDAYNHAVSISPLCADEAVIPELSEHKVIHFLFQNNSQVSKASPETVWKHPLMFPFPAAEDVYKSHVMQTCEIDEEGDGVAWLHSNSAASVCYSCRGILRASLSAEINRCTGETEQLT